MERGQGASVKEEGVKTANKAMMRREINDLTPKTKREQSQFRAVKSFRFDGRLQNKPKTKPVSPLDRGCVKKQSQRCELEPKFASRYGTRHRSVVSKNWVTAKRVVPTK